MILRAASSPLSSGVIGGDVIITLPPAWQRRFNASSVEVRPRIDDLVDPVWLEELSKLEDFNRAYEPAGLAVDEFDTFGLSVKTLRTFIGSYHELLHLTGEALLA